MDSYCEKRPGLVEVKDMCSTEQEIMWENNQIVSTTKCCPTTQQWATEDQINQIVVVVNPSL